MLLGYLLGASLVALVTSNNVAPPPCGLPVCERRCPYGTEFQTDENGCEVCKCLPEPRCTVPKCAYVSFCRYGFKKMEDGCISPTCECNTPVCPRLTCNARRCRLGFATDSVRFGCPTCECRRRQSPEVCRPLPCLALLDCFSGAPIVRIKGCPVCLCGPAPVCPRLNCQTRCTHGNVFVRGCRTCSCRPPPVTCRSIACKRKTCLHGFAKNDRGCPTCQCNRSKRPYFYIGKK